ncbi:RHS repeat-associated core domain-containing protein [Epilithonimonas mollis]
MPFGEMSMEQSSGDYNNVHKYNGKELHEATGLYYYGARYYDPNKSIWLSVDPLASVLPDWNPYAYSFNNPIMYSDPTGLFPDAKGGPRFRSTCFDDIDGPRPNLSGIKNVTNVLKGKKWIPYMSKTIQDSEINFNFTQGFTRNNFCRTGECAEYSKLQAEQIKGYTSVGAKKRVDMYVDARTEDQSRYNLQEGVDILIKNLKAGRAVRVGVMYDANKTTQTKDYANKSTNHYVTVVGMGTDKEGAYFSYYDNYAGEGHIEQNVGTNINLNKFRLFKAKNGTYYFSDGADGSIPYNQNQQPKKGQHTRYILTEVRDNE